MAVARDTVLNCRESIARARRTERDDPPSRGWVREYELRKQLEMVRAARQLLELLLAQAVAVPTPDRVLECETRLGFPPGLFAEAMRELRVSHDIQLGRFLAMAEEMATAQLAEPEPPPVSSDYLPAVIRVCCATMVGALIGAPLGALAIQEAVLKKMAEAAIVVGISSIAVEIAVPLSELARSPVREPAADAATVSAIDAVVEDLLLTDTERGRLHRLAEEPSADVAGDAVADDALESPVDKPAEDAIEEAVEDPVADDALDRAIDDDLERAVEEALKEPVDEAVDEAVDEPAAEILKDPVEAPVEKPLERLVEEPTADVADDALEAPLDKPAEDAIEQPAEDAVENAVEDPVADDALDRAVDDDLERAVEEALEKSVDEPLAEVVEDPVERPVEEPDDLFEDPFSRGW